MAICEQCGKKFSKEEAEEYFSSEIFSLSYDRIRVCLCGKCAVQAIDDCVDSVYYEQCEECGKTFDLFEEESEFNSHFDWYNGTTLRDHWQDKILCAECALNLLDEMDE